MPDTVIQLQDQTLKVIGDALQSGTMQRARRILNALHPAEIANLLEALPHSQRGIVWNMLDHDDDGEILLNVGDEVRNGLIQNMDSDALVSATEGLEMDDLADLLADLPDTVTEQALAGMDYQDRLRLEAVLAYDEDTAGGLMNTDTVTVRRDVTLDVVLRYLRSRGELPRATDSLFVVDRYDHYIGTLPLTSVLTNKATELVRDIMVDDVEAFSADAEDNVVAKSFEDLDLLSAAVVDENNKLIGRITVDDVVDVIREEAEHSVFSMAGLSEEEDLFGPIVSSTRRRAIWLGVNLATAFLAAWVISLFQPTLEKIIVLAILIPVVASMGGIAGSQTLTLVIRGIATGQVGRSNSRLLLTKELAVGFLNGMVWAIVVAIVVVLWFKDIKMGGIIAAAMAANLICAALAGVTIPIILRKLKIDPALAGGVVLTTITDVIGIFAFLGLATWLLI
ncbi:MAG: magnesium transporter [Gammaproteobacteria bacterium]|nr:MAG: magnesium transporter [Gammaproteobacteria bacterium]